MNLPVSYVGADHSVSPQLSAGFIPGLKAQLSLVFMISDPTGVSNPSFSFSKFFTLLFWDICSFLCPAECLQEPATGGMFFLRLIDVPDAPCSFSRMNQGDQMREGSHSGSLQLPFSFRRRYGQNQ
jgi:hypothetical protein